NPNLYIVDKAPEFPTMENYARQLHNALKVQGQNASLQDFSPPYGYCYGVHHPSIYFLLKD
ncbi:hypothetical protein, partial [Chlorogloeopsis sp. ULAP02]|uniref:hypothetical protein n=1 Tax=Chlorogloeopsis sp. ULAP02 TaxID=3107926 RepID=UPI00398BAE57